MSLFFSAWQLVIRRSLANWRLLSCIMVGVLVAVALLSSTPLYSNALNDLGLAHALGEKPIELLDVHIYARSYHIDLEDYSRGRELVNRRASRNIGALVHQEERYIKSQTFSAAWADYPTPDDPDTAKGKGLVCLMFLSLLWPTSSCHIWPVVERHTNTTDFLRQDHRSCYTVNIQDG